VKTGGLPWIWE